VGLATLTWLFEGEAVHRHTWAWCSRFSSAKGTRATASFRCARPTNALAPLRRFHCKRVEGTELGRSDDHATFDGPNLGKRGESWQREFVVE
jgi:hypothetical protein